MADETISESPQSDTKRRRSATRTKRAPIKREFTLTQYVCARDVQQALGCSISHAYEHLRRAIGRTTGRGMLRAPIHVWEAYAQGMYGAKAAGPSDALGSL